MLLLGGLCLFLAAGYYVNEWQHRLIHEDRVLTRAQKEQAKREQKRGRKIVKRQMDEIKQINWEIEMETGLQDVSEILQTNTRGTLSVISEESRVISQ